MSMGPSVPMWSTFTCVPVSQATAGSTASQVSELFVLCVAASAYKLCIVLCCVMLRSCLFYNILLRSIGRAQQRSVMSYEIMRNYYVFITIF